MVPGITSACAEQTPMNGSHAGRRRDHLRVCGADLPQVGQVTMVAGSPPRVRSRLWIITGLLGAAGITSACAEQTWGA